MANNKYVRQLYIDTGMYSGFNIDVEIVGLAGNNRVQVRPIAGNGIIEVHASKLGKTIKPKEE